jgi:hypothetical protein
MPWSGGSFTRTNGVNTGATLWEQDRDDGTKILATRHDTNDQDMADGINSTLEKSGSNAATGNLDIGSNRITLVADGTAKTDVATVNQIQSDGPAFQATDTGTANTYVIALTPAITAYAAGQRITFKAGAASTTASTLNVNTLGVKALKKLHDQDIASGDIETGSIVTAVYDGTNFQITSQLATETNVPAGAADNLVINGQCLVSQRGTSFTGLGSGTSDEYTLDRWSLTTLDTSTARWTVSQETGGGTSGKDPWLKILNTTADASPGAGEGQLQQQKMEGYVAQPLLGSSDGIIDGFTVSADMILHADGASSISFPATISCIAYTIDTGRGCIIDATIAADATWERVEFVFPADTSGTFNIDNTVGFRVGFGLYGGTSRDAAAGSWFSAALNASVSEDAENIADATNNYLGFTNVQLETGSVATSFAYEDIGTTLQKCFRYLERITPAGNGQPLGTGFAQSTTAAQITLLYSEKRVVPTITGTAASTFAIVHTGAVDAGTGSESWDQTGTTSCRMNLISGGSMTDGNGVQISRNSTATCYIQMSAEL